MKRAFLLWLAACLPALAGLKFETKTEKLEASPEETVVKAQFPFTNDGNAPVKLKRIDAGCSCVSAKTSDGKMTFAPGEKGVIQASFDISNFSGEAQKEIGVWLEGQAEESPEAVLSFTVKVPVVVVAEPKTVFWDLGSKAEPQKVTLTMNYGEPIHITEIDIAPDANFSQTLKVIEDGKKYEMTITPKDTSKVTIGVFHVETDCKIERHQSQRVFCSTRKPVPAPPQADTKR